MQLDRLSMILVGSNADDASMLQGMIAEASSDVYQIEYDACNE